MKTTQLITFFFICLLLFACTDIKKTTTNQQRIEILGGNWLLTYITGPRIAFDGLYPDKKPTMTIDVVNRLVSGNTGCNNFTGSFYLNGHKIGFLNSPLAMTQMMCINTIGEVTFIETLKKVTSWSLGSDSTLRFFFDDVAIMSFARK